MLLVTVSSGGMLSWMRHSGLLLCAIRSHSVCRRSLMLLSTFRFLQSHLFWLAVINRIVLVAILACSQLMLTLVPS